SDEKCQLNSRPCSGVAGQCFCDGSGNFALSETSQTGCETHAQANADWHRPVTGRCATALCVHRRSYRQNNQQQQEKRQFSHILLLLINFAASWWLASVLGDGALTHAAFSNYSLVLFADSHAEVNKREHHKNESLNK